MKPESLGPFTLSLTEACFPLGQDSLALGDFATVRPHWRVCDLGCGGGTLLLLLARREPTLRLTGIELSAAPAQAARRNMADNGLSATVLHGDLREKGLLTNEGFEAVVSNPPYFSAQSGKSGGQARCEETCTLEELCAAARRTLKTGGRFALVHRPERLPDLFCTLRALRLEPKRLRFLCHDPGAAPSAVLVESVKNGKPGLQILPAQFTEPRPNAASRDGAES